MEANYLVVNANESGRVMSVVSFKTKEEAREYISNISKQMCEEISIGYADNAKCQISEDNLFQTIVLSDPHGATMCTWDIFPVKNIQSGTMPHALDPKAKNTEQTLEKTSCGEIFKRTESSGYGTVGLRVHTNIGDMTAYPNTDPLYPGINLVFVPKNESEQNTEIDLTMAEVDQDPENEEKDTNVRLYEFADPYTEDWTHTTTIMLSDMADAIKEAD